MSLTMTHFTNGTLTYRNQVKFVNIFGDVSREINIEGRKKTREIPSYNVSIKKGCQKCLVDTPSKIKSGEVQGRHLNPLREA